MKSILIVFGTRPEAIKLAPLIAEAKKNNSIKTLVCSTGQHREMLKPVLSFFDITPDFDLDIMKPNQTLASITADVLTGIDAILKQHNVDAVIAQGDTTTCFAAGLAAFYNQKKVFHIEAGLRSENIYSPFPEEFNRMATSLIANHHFAPTAMAQNNLLNERHTNNTISTTGNTGIDALFEVLAKIHASPDIKEKLEQRFSFLNPQKKLILATIHRRESYGTTMDEIMGGLLDIASRDDVEILIPLHLNPQVRASANKVFGNKAAWENSGSKSNIWFLEPVDYIPFVYLMQRAHFIVSDSGGIQEEAPALGKPVLVVRDTTERPEGIAAGTSKLAPLKRAPLAESIQELLDNSQLYKKMATAKNPFGDGNASKKIMTTIANTLKPD